MWLVPRGRKFGVVVYDNYRLDLRLGPSSLHRAKKWPLVKTKLGADLDAARYLAATPTGIGLIELLCILLFLLEFSLPSETR